MLEWIGDEQAGVVSKTGEHGALDQRADAGSTPASRCFDLIVYGSPAPQGSKRPVGLDGKGRARMIESSKHVKPWRQTIVAAAVDPTRQPLEGPLDVRMVFTVRKPASAPKRRRIWPMTMPDLSKLARACEDALTDAGVWRSDAQVVCYSRLAKVYPGEDAEALHVPGVRIHVEEVADD